MLVKNRGEQLETRREKFLDSILCMTVKIELLIKNPDERSLTYKEIIGSADLFDKAQLMPVYRQKALSALQREEEKGNIFHIMVKNEKVYFGNPARLKTYKAAGLVCANDYSSVYHSSIKDVMEKFMLFIMGLAPGTRFNRKKILQAVTHLYDNTIMAELYWRSIQEAIGEVYCKGIIDIYTLALELHWYIKIADTADASVYSYNQYLQTRSDIIDEIDKIIANGPGRKFTMEELLKSLPLYNPDIFYSAYSKCASNCLVVRGKKKIIQIEKRAEETYYIVGAPKATEADTAGAKARYRQIFPDLKKGLSSLIRNARTTETITAAGALYALNLPVEHDRPFQEQCINYICGMFRRWVNKGYLEVLRPGKRRLYQRTSKEFI